jgi:hypothetical protein
MAFWMARFSTQQVVQNFRFADVGNRNNFYVVAARRQFIGLPADTPETHQANTNRSISRHHQFPR